MTLVSVISDLYKTTMNAPARIQGICWVQFWSWIGWFPFLFYGTTWIGEIYLRHGASTSTEDALTKVGRAGSQAMIVFSLVSFMSSIVLPWFVMNPEEDQVQPATSSRVRGKLKTLFHEATRTKPTLLTVWMLANLLFTSTMLFAPLVRSVLFATCLVAFCGIPWAVGAWAPVAFIGIEVNRLNPSLPLANGTGPTALPLLADDALELEETSQPVSLHVRHASTASSVAISNTTGEQSGTYIGILNIYTTLPQFVGTGISWIVFSILEPGQSPELAPDAPINSSTPRGVSGISVCLFIGAVSAAGAAFATRRLRV